MGMKGKERTGLGDVLFSRTQQQVLGLLFANPGRSYYVNEIVRAAEVGIGTVQRELTRLSNAGLLTVRKVGNQKHYQANPDSPIFEELCGIARKTFGLGDVLRQALAELAEQVRCAFVYGSVAGGTDTAGSDIDVMIVAEDLSYARVFAALSTLEGELGRTVNPALYTPAEFRKKLAADTSFVKRLVEGPKIFLIGSEDDIPKP